MNINLTNARSTPRYATLFIWAGWAIFVTSFFMPVFSIPIPDPQLGPLLFLGIPLPRVNESADEVEMIAIAVQGKDILFFMLTKLLEKAELSLIYTIIFWLFLPFLLAPITPAINWIGKRKINLFICALYVLTSIGLALFFISIRSSDLLHSGAYLWLSSFILFMLAFGFQSRAST